MTAAQPAARARSDAGFTLMETLVALTIFSVGLLMFEQTISSAWRGINAANAKTAAVTLALSVLEGTGADAAFASEPETVGQSGIYEWRRRIWVIDRGSASAERTSDEVTDFWVEVEVSWRDAASPKPQSIHYRLLKSGRKTS